MNKLRRTTAGLVAALAASATALTALPAEAAQGNRSIAKVLAADGNRFDRNWDDFDITEKAVLAVLKAKPDSAVKLLTQGSKRATVFVPTDRAFRILVGDLTGKRPGTEAKTFKAVAGLGVDTIEAVLLYHVVAGKTLVSEKVVAADGSFVRTAAGTTFKVVVGHEGVVRIRDKDYNAENAEAIPRLLDINRGNKQVAHGIDRVLRPVDL